MAYEPHNWKNNEAISASQLNAMALGVADAERLAAQAFAAADAANEDLAAVRDELDELREAIATLAR